MNTNTNNPEQGGGNVKVRIERCDFHWLWYIGLIGHEFKVVSDRDYIEKWRVYDAPLWVYKSDCIVLSPTPSETDNQPEQCEGCKGDEVIEVPQFAAKDGKGPDWDGIEKFIVNEIKKAGKGDEKVVDFTKFENNTFKKRTDPANIHKEKKQGEFETEAIKVGVKMLQTISQQEATIKQLQNRIAEQAQEIERWKKRHDDLVPKCDK